MFLLVSFTEGTSMLVHNMLESFYFVGVLGGQVENCLLACSVFTKCL